MPIRLTCPCENNIKTKETREHYKKDKGREKDTRKKEPQQTTEEKHADDSIQTNKQTPWPLVRKRTIPTERPPLVDEI
jgi:hypothetical protein